MLCDGPPKSKPVSLPKFEYNRVVPSSDSESVAKGVSHPADGKSLSEVLAENF
jgi:hypothetical protein